MYIVFDIGGTKTRVAGSKDGRTLDRIEVRETEKEWKKQEIVLEEIIKLVRQGEPVEAVAGGMAGVFDAEAGTLVRSPHLLDWLGKPIKETLVNLSGAPKIVILNDTVAAGLGEAHFGAGEGKDIVVYMTVSTGVGGAKIERGHFDDARIGQEPGQQIIDADKLVTLESLVSGSSFEKRFGPDFVKAAPESAWLEAARYLAIGVHNTIVHWSPDVLVLGGSMMTKPPAIPVAEVRRQVKEIMKIFPGIPPIELSILGDKAGLFGGLAYLNLV